MTKGKLAFAQELMTLEVRQRQEDMMNPVKYFAEILKSDLERINKDLRDNMPVEPVSDDGSSGEDEYDHENEQDDRRDEEHDQQGEKVEQERMQIDQGQTMETDGGNHIQQENIAETDGLVDVKREDASDDADGRSGAEARARETVSRTPTRAVVTKSKANLQKQAKILRLRADAMRPKQEAAKRMAEAYELEAKMFSAEAKQFDD
jgi:hypothetical protein